MSFLNTVLIYRTAKNYYYLGNCPGIIGTDLTDLYSTREMSGIIRTGMQLHVR